GTGGSAAIDNFSFQESIADVHENELLSAMYVYPNPVGDRLFIQAPAGVRFQMELLDISGRILNRYEVSGGQSVDFSGLIPGCYTVILSMEDGSRKSNRIIKY
ncbi:MAG: Secretion system C-terminal sorting domain, partial [Bacteroidota bacterium]